MGLAALVALLKSVRPRAARHVTNPEKADASRRTFLALASAGTVVAAVSLTFGRSVRTFGQTSSASTLPSRFQSWIRMIGPCGSTAWLRMKWLQIWCSLGSIDGFAASTPLEALTDSRDSLLAVGMNGEPLPAQHGFPARLVVPGLYGYVSATKWVVELEVTRFHRQTAYWTDRGWDERAPVLVASRIDVPQENQTVSSGDVVIAGVAWAQHVGIETVEVQIDDGDWEEAELASEVSIDTWRQWRYVYSDAEPGQHQVQVRATNAEGQTQTAQRQSPIPNAATGYHRLDFSVD